MYIFCVRRTAKKNFLNTIFVGNVKNDPDDYFITRENCIFKVRFTINGF